VRVISVVLAVALTGCEAEVVLGRYLPLDAKGDASVLDGGAVALDAGEPDAGRNDAGVFDAGFGANLALRFVGPFITDVDSGSFPLQFEVQNTGDLPVAGVTFNLVAPPEVEFLSFTGCALDAGSAVCTAPALGPSGTRTFSALVRFPTAA
jgi:hypothetical protein